MGVPGDFQGQRPEAQASLTTRPPPTETDPSLRPTWDPQPCTLTQYPPPTRQERAQAKTQTYLRSTWGRSSPENTHTQTPGRSPCSCLCCGRDQRGRRVPLWTPAQQSARGAHRERLPNTPPGNQIARLGHQLELVSRNQSRCGT